MQLARRISIYIEIIVVNFFQKYLIIDRINEIIQQMWEWNLQQI